MPFAGVTARAGRRSLMTRAGMVTGEQPLHLRYNHPLPAALVGAGATSAGGPLRQCRHAGAQEAFPSLPTRLQNPAPHRLMGWSLARTPSDARACCRSL